ncbi:MAG: VOC family protein, partial [Actinomycetota bacterium]
AAGATVFRVLSEDGVDYYAVVMQDPEGNEFCLH